MVEECYSSQNNKSNKTVQKTTKPKSVYLWTIIDVQKWLRRFCSDYYSLYVDQFVQNEITGRALIRLNDNSLLRLGIADKKHQEEIYREILKLKLKTDIIELRDLQHENPYYDF